MKKYLLLLIIPFIIGIVLSQGVSNKAPIPVPVDDRIEVCWSYNIKKVSTTVHNDIECRKYPKDIENYCYRDRYDNIVFCENLLTKEVNRDAMAWYKEDLKDYAGLSVNDVIITSVTGTATDLVGKQYDFMNGEFK